MKKPNNRPFAQSPARQIPLHHQVEHLPSDAFVIEALVGDSLALGTGSGNTLENGSLAVPPTRSLIWNKWAAGAGASRTDTSLSGTGFAQVGLNLGDTASDIGPEVFLGSGREEFFADKTGRSSRYGLVKCAAAGADVSLPPLAGATSLAPAGTAGLFNSLVDGHLKPAINWCHDQNLSPYLGAIYVSVGASDAQGAPERAMSFFAYCLSFARALAERLGLTALPKTYILRLPTDVPSAVYPNKASLREQYKFLSARPPFALVDISAFPRQADGFNLTGQGQAHLGALLARVARNPDGYGHLQYVERF